jgi:hypothetical protein
MILVGQAQITCIGLMEKICKRSLHTHAQVHLWMYEEDDRASVCSAT